MTDADTNTPLSDALQRQRQENDIDCLPCRLTGESNTVISLGMLTDLYPGSAAFTGLGIYSLVTGMSQLKKREYEILKSGSKIPMVLRQANVFLFSGVLVGLGVYRLYN